MRASITLSLFLSLHQLTAQVPQFYGMTPSGGANDKGIIFRVNGDGSDYQIEYEFDQLSGYGPEGSLCLAPNGKLYGMTNLGGEAPGSPAGTLFKFDPGGAGFTKLVDFDLLGGNGAFGWGSMMVANDGMLYGATYGGGGSGGSIFRVDPATDSYTIIEVLDQTLDGGSITDALIQGADGKLYGCGAYGGANNAGVIFSYDIGSDTYTKLHDFDEVNGRTPYGALCQAGNGTLYGMTWEGGTSDMGVFYKIDPDGSDFVKLFDFTGTNGQTPWNHMVVAGPDLLYGAVTLGGSVGSGMLFSYLPSTNTFSEIHGFNTLDGGLLFGSPLLASDGKLYGMGGSGGDFFFGSVYRFDIGAIQLTTVHSFQSPDGYTPRGDLVQVGLASGIAEMTGSSAFTLWPNPTSGSFTVDLNDPAWLGSTITITNSLGQRVQEMLVTSAEIRLELDQASGVYLLTLCGPQGRSAARIIVDH